MADTITTHYSFVQPQVGGSANTWGTKLNANWGAADTAIKANADAADAAAIAASAAQSTADTALTAAGTTYSNASSGIAANNVQTAIDIVAVTAAQGPTIASTGEAVAGSNNTNFITPLRMRQGFNAAGSAPVFACRVYVQFRGSDGAIRLSGNVSSVTRQGAGIYRVNFATALPTANYACSASAGRYGNTKMALGSAPTGANPTTTSCGVSSAGTSVDTNDHDPVSLALFC